MTSLTELRALGGLVVCVDGEPQALGGPKAEQLLSVLVAHRRTPVSSGRLIETLWTAGPPKSALATVQSLISRLRAVLAPSFSITNESAGYRLDTTQGVIDADRFEALLLGSRILGAAESVPALESALALWRGPAFAQHAALPEVQSEAVRLDELRLVATDEWAEAKLATGDPATMVGDLEALVRLHPLRERYWQLLVLALYRTGRQAEALRRIGDLRGMLGEEMGLDLSPTIRDLEAKILADDPSLSLRRDRERISERRASGVAPEMLGATSFIGRDPDVHSLSEALEGQPLVTLTGPGGVGKTRLAMQVAARILDRFEDGVTVVEFASLRDPAGVAQVIAHALDIQQRQHRTLEATIEEHLASATCLLVLDNCEHITDALAPLVDRLRSSCAHVRILATSREPLGLAGEYVQVLAPLGVPGVGAAAEEIRRSPAVELFVARAAVATPGFGLGDDNAAVVAEVCRRLDGLPLALELGAARLRSMGIDALADRLHQRIDILGQTQRGADRRHRTLHHLVEWSHDLLAPEEQEVFEQLSVFAGGFDLTGADAVCSVGTGASSTIATLADLVDKSMVVLVDPGAPRYRLLEPLREFGLERLRERGDLEAVEQRHLEWFLDVATRGAVGLDTADEATWSEQLDRDYDNFRAAHRTAIQRGDADRALELVAALREFAFRRISYEIIGWADASAALTGVDHHPDLPTVVAVSAYGRFVQGDMEAAVRLARPCARRPSRAGSVRQRAPGANTGKRALLPGSDP